EIASVTGVQTCALPILEPACGETVKCLLALGGITLIERQLGYLRASGISEIAVVVGFQAERIRCACGPEVEYIENPIFAETNSIDRKSVVKGKKKDVRA